MTGSQHPGGLSHCYRCDNIALIVIPSPVTPRLLLKSFAQCLVVSLNFRDEVLAAEYHKIRALQGTKVP